jgi:hypothetical protein
VSDKEKALKDAASAAARLPPAPPPKDVLLVGYLIVFEQPHPGWPDRRGFYCYKQLVIVPIASDP